MLELETVRKLVLHDLSSGKLFWRERGPDSITDDAKRRAWNTRWAGKEVGNIRQGYRVCEIFGRPYKVHRIIWFLEYGYWPEVVDHIDGDGLNNLLENLRDVSQAENTRNAAAGNNNTSGRVGVSKLRRTDHWGECWQAYISANGKRISLGLFKSFEDACAARSDAELQYGYHENHGRAAA